MRLTELAQATGVPVATVKYYLREGLLHPGRAVTARLADYDESHVRRLRLLRVLRDVGDVPVSRLQALAQAVETESSLHDLLGVAADALAPTPPPDSPGRGPHRQTADALIEAAGWQVRPGTPDRENLAAALETLAEHTGRPVDPRVLAPYVRAADELAHHEISNLDDSRGRGRLLEQMVLGQVVFGHVLDILRRLAEEHHSSLRFSGPAG
jgi:DNA-binding transcriptional MerR regulator